MDWGWEPRSQDQMHVTTRMSELKKKSHRQRLVLTFTVSDEEHCPVVYFLGEIVAGIWEENVMLEILNTEAMTVSDPFHYWNSKQTI